MTRGVRVAQIAAIACFFALAAFSTGLTFEGTWDFLQDQRDSYADLTAAEPNVVPEFQTLLPVSAVNFFSSRMRRSDRFYVQAAEGPFIAGVDYPTAVRTFARFELLPAVLVRDPAHERRHRILVLARDMQGLAAGDEQLELRASCK